MLLLGEIHQGARSPSKKNPAVIVWDTSAASQTIPLAAWDTVR
jgi:hypothetical protein